MHLHMIGLALAIAIGSRMLNRTTMADSRHLPTRWHLSLIMFVVPPLLLLATAVAVVVMGPSTAHLWEGQLSYGLSLSFIVVAVGLWIHLARLVSQTLREVQRYPRQQIKAFSSDAVPEDAVPDDAVSEDAVPDLVTGRVLNVATVFSAQIGLWSSELVISEGLLRHLDEQHLAAVLAHEAGHAHYRDTFWFFWLGGLRRLTAWLPQTEALWQELLLLREMRADCWAAQRVDTLVLAESLMSVITAPLIENEAICASFSCAAPRSRLAQRVDALLDSDDNIQRALAIGGWGHPWPWLAIALSLSPLLTIPFHY
ncbi:MAG: M48 family metalloprotease [Phormidesmis sp. RL_2_1]|nr:M48 family metalloprotease [Phormidesmis sp. RL_2_1]